MQVIDRVWIRISSRWMVANTTRITFPSRESTKIGSGTMYFVERCVITPLFFPKREVAGGGSQPVQRPTKALLGGRLALKTAATVGPSLTVSQLLLCHCVIRQLAAPHGFWRRFRPAKGSSFRSQQRTCQRAMRVASSLSDRRIGSLTAPAKGVPPQGT